MRFGVVTGGVADSAAPSISAAAAQPTANTSIIRASGRRFVDDACREFLYTGWNS